MDRVAADQAPQALEPHRWVSRTAPPDAAQEPAARVVAYLVTASTLTGFSRRVAWPSNTSRVRVQSIKGIK